jgi:hypothetical protein
LNLLLHSCVHAAALLLRHHRCSKDWDAALQALARGMTRHPGLPELPWYAGWICYQAGRCKEVRPAYVLSCAVNAFEEKCSSACAGQSIS